MTTQFKQTIKENKEAIKGKVIRIMTSEGGKSFYTLKEFGARILELEARGLSFLFRGYYTKDNEVVRTSNFSEIIGQIKENGARGFIIDATYIAKDKSDYIRHNFTTC